MIAHYYKSFKNLIDLIHSSKLEPFSNISSWLIVQEELIVKISYVERQINICRKKIKYAKSQLGDPNNKLPKIVAEGKKKEMKYLQYKIDQYFKIRTLYKNIGDSIVFVFINGFDVKPQSFKQTAGFLSGKKGNRLERKCLRGSYKLGKIAILNDLTNVLRYFDLTLITSFDAWIPFEIKSGNYKNDRVERQAENGTSLLKYLFEDKPTNLNNSGKVLERRALSMPIINNIPKFNELLNKSKETGLVLEELEDGLVILIDYNFNAGDNLNEMLDGMGLIKPIMFFLNEYKFNNLCYMPLSLIFEESENYIKYLKGEIVIIQFLDINYFDLLLRPLGYTIDFSDNEEYYIDYKKLESGEVIASMSHHYFSRIFFEFLSPSWLIKEPISYLDTKFN